MGTLEFFRERVFSIRLRQKPSATRRQLHQHEELRTQLARTQHVVTEVANDVKAGRRPAGTVRAVSRDLSGLETSLTRHFGSEESSSALDDVLRAAPRHYARAKALVAQHRTLRREMSAIRELGEICGRSAERWSELQWRLAAFGRKLHAHERAENEIASKVLYEDIGTQD